MLSKARGKRFQLVLIKPSHYDDDGYVVQWLRSTMPSNSLAAVYSLALGAADAPSARAGPSHRRRRHRRDQYPRAPARYRQAHRQQRRPRPGRARRRAIEPVSPRARHRASRLRAAGIQVMIGGFHVSGCLAMLKETQADIKAAQDLGVSIFAGEAEEGFDEVLHDAAKGELKPLYNHMKKSCPASATCRPRPSCPSTSSTAPSAMSRASTPAAAARSNARSAPSSMCRGASRAIARPTTSSRSCA